MATRKTENCVDLLAMRTESFKAPSSKLFFALHPTGREFRCASSMGPALHEEGAMDLLRWLGFLFCGVVGVTA